MRYYVLSTPAGDEVARLSRGSASYFETETGRWIPDPLLALEVQMDDDWREVDAHELPPGIPDVDPQDGRSRGPRRGRHSRK